MSVGIFLVSLFTFVELNCENLFDCQHDSLKDDEQFLPESGRHWTYRKYWDKLNNISKEIISCGSDSTDWTIPDMVALCEIENDTVMRDLTKRSLLRKARYEYVMTDSPDPRGIDVALMYQPSSFGLINHYSMRVVPLAGHAPTRDILYVSGNTISGDTLHIYVIHAPSRVGGEAYSRPFRLRVAERLGDALDSLRQITPHPNVMIAGDFNDYATDSVLMYLHSKGMIDISAEACGSNGAKGTYKFSGKWGSLDHILVGGELVESTSACFINDYPFLLEDDNKYGGVMPRRNYKGYRYNRGFSDHLPLVVKFMLR